MKIKEQVANLIIELKSAYPEALCALDPTEPFQLLVAVRLSAQCTDKRVNAVTPALFARFPDAESFAQAEITEVEELIRPCGLYRSKARDLLLMSRTLLEKYNGIIPDTVEELVKLPGVGRKSANLIVGDVYGKPAVVTDTHVIRISNLLGLVNTKVPRAVEDRLRKLLPEDESNDFCHRIVLHGRAVCVARSPKCGVCTLRSYCKFGKSL